MKQDQHQLYMQLALRATAETCLRGASCEFPKQLASLSQEILGTRRWQENILEEWLKKIEDSFSFSSAKNVFRSKHKGKTSYTDRITAVYPTYLHDLWRHATTLLGDNATFEEIAIQMNLQSTTEVFLPTLALIKWSLHRWFKKNKKLLSLVKTKIIETYATGCI